MSFQDTSETRSANLNEVFTYKAAWPIYAFSFSDRIGTSIIGSMLERPVNYLQLLSFSCESSKIILKSSVEHPYPATKIMWSPESQQSPIFGTSSDCLRLWKCEDDTISIKASLVPHYENKEYNGPLTSFDWSSKDPNTLGTSSIDKTCTIWDLTKLVIKKQILAHNNEVNDIAFSHDSNVFVSASTDASVRKFDLRNLDQCSIIYENPRQMGVARVCWNRFDPNYLAVLNIDSACVAILDIRNQMYPIIELKGHTSGINGLCWAPTSYSICTAGDDHQVIIKDTIKTSPNMKENTLVYGAGEKVLGVSWSINNEIGMVLTDSLQYIKL